MSLDVALRFTALAVFCRFADVDECAAGHCSQQCVNTVGSFVCSCNPGYTLNNDGTTCDGNSSLTVY